MNYNLTTEEMNLLAAFDMGDRMETIAQMRDMCSQLGALAFRLRYMTDEAYDNLELVVDARN